jgi:hypothetical protein
MEVILGHPAREPQKAGRERRADHLNDRLEPLPVPLLRKRDDRPGHPPGAERNEHAGPGNDPVVEFRRHAVGKRFGEGNADGYINDTVGHAG